MKVEQAGRVALLVLLCVGLLWAAEPWKDKPYTEWTQKEVERVVQDSPWARLIEVLGTSGPGEGAIARSEVSGTKPMSDTAGPQVQARYLVQWASALTMRQAQVRSAQLAGREDPENSKAMLAAAPPSYILSVLGSNMTGFEEIKEEGTKAAAYLELKSSKMRVTPDQVQFFRPGGRLAQVFIFFPREAEGKPVIPATENKVEFHCRVGKNEIEATFDLRKMVTRDGKPDL
ncbi:MAG TPA: hypothetical protein VNN18_07180 [Candidatus Xenobia bacterium]|nr:hypothetical protein [Candidatus Xenobia bacterium]